VTMMAVFSPEKVTEYEEGTFTVLESASKRYVRHNPLPFLFHGFDLSLSRRHRSLEAPSSGFSLLHDAPTSFTVSFPFQDHVYSMGLDQTLSQSYEFGGLHIPVVRYSAIEVLVDGLPVPESFANVQILSLAPLVLDGHLSVGPGFLVLKAVRAAGAGPWERTVVYDADAVSQRAEDVSRTCGVHETPEQPSRRSMMAEADRAMASVAKRYIVGASMYSFEVGLFVDCSFVAYNDNDLTATVTDIMNAVAFANTKYSSTFKLNMFVRPTRLLLNPTCNSSGINADCANAGNITVALYAFQDWSGTQEVFGAWVKLTACYEPQIDVPTAVGLAFVGTFCTPYAAAVVSRVDVDIPYYITFTHELGHVFGSYHDSYGNDCPASVFIMSAITPTDATISFNFSDCSQTSINAYLAQTVTPVDSCIKRADLAFSLAFSTATPPAKFISSLSPFQPNLNSVLPDGHHLSNARDCWRRSGAAAGAYSGKRCLVSDQHFVSRLLS